MSLREDEFDEDEFDEDEFDEASPPKTLQEQESDRRQKLGVMQPTNLVAITPSMIQENIMLSFGVADSDIGFDETRLSHEHVDQYEEGRFNLSDFFDWDDDGEECDEPDCQKSSGLARADPSCFD